MPFSDDDPEYELALLAEFNSISERLGSMQSHSRGCPDDKRQLVERGFDIMCTLVRDIMFSQTQVATIEANLLRCAARTIHHSCKQENQENARLNAIENAELYARQSEFGLLPARILSAIDQKVAEAYKPGQRGSLDK